MMLAIFKRELKAYFTTPTAYVFMTGFFVLAGLFFIIVELQSRIGRFNVVLDNMRLVLLFMIPALTMRLIAEEKKTKVDVLLLTSPVSTASIVIEKFLAATVVFLTSIVISFIYPGILMYFTHVPIGETINAYIGYTVLGMAFISICLFASALTDSQVVGFMVGFCMILTMWILEFTQGMINNVVLAKIVKWVSLLSRYDEMVGGIFELAPLVYYLSVIILFLFLTVGVLERRKWNKG